MNGSMDLEGVHGMINALDLEGSRLPDCQDFSQTMGCCMRQKMRWPHVFRVVFHCLWVWQGRTDVSERVYGLGRGPWHDKCVGFGVRRAARSHRFQPNNGVL